MPYIWLEESSFPKNSSKSSGKKTSYGNPAVVHPVTTNIWLLVVIPKCFYFLHRDNKQLEIKISGTHI